MYAPEFQSEMQHSDFSLQSRKEGRLTDAQIWQAFKRGNELAYSAMYRDHARLLYSYAMRLVNDRELVMDAIQDLFVELWETKDRLGDVRSIKLYLISSIRRKVIYQSSRQRKGSVSLSEADAVVTAPSSEHVLIEKQVMNENLDKLNQAISELKPDQREVLYLKYYGRMSYDEIAQVVGSDKKAVYNLMARTIRILRDSFEISLILTILSFLF